MKSLHISPVKKTFNKEEDLHLQVQCDAGHEIEKVWKKKNRSIFAAYRRKQLILLSIAGQETAAIRCLFTVQGVQFEAANNVVTQNSPNTKRNGELEMLIFIIIIIIRVIFMH